MDPNKPILDSSSPLSTPQVVLPQIPPNPFQNIPPTPPHSKFKMVKVAALLLLIILILISGFYINTHPSLLTKFFGIQSPKPPATKTGASDHDKTNPEGWITEEGLYCNLTFTYPPKKAPFTEKVDSSKPDTSQGNLRYWNIHAVTLSAKDVYLNFHTVVMFASDVAEKTPPQATILVECAPNTNNLSPDQVLTEYLAKLPGKSTIKLKNKNSTTLWGKKVTAATLLIGTKNQLSYFAATDKYIYKISEDVISTNPAIKDAADKVLSQIQF